MIRYFDGVLNLFTSLGYFSDKRENRSVVDSVCKGLCPGGIFVIDFFNAAFVAREINRCNSGTKEVAGIHFGWEKQIVNGIIRKTITVKDGLTERKFTEYVQLLSEKDFDELLAPHFRIEKKFGDYDLSDFDPEHSKRLILIARKR